MGAILTPWTRSTGLPIRDRLSSALDDLGDSDDALVGFSSAERGVVQLAPPTGGALKVCC